MSEVRTTRTSEAAIENPDRAVAVDLIEVIASCFREAQFTPPAAQRVAPKLYQLPADSPLTALNRRQLALPADVATMLPVTARSRLDEILKSVPHVGRTLQPELRKLAREVVLHAREPSKLERTLAVLNRTVQNDFSRVTAEMVFTRARETLAELKFDHLVARPESGYLKASQGRDGPTIRLDVRPSAAGGVELDSDADGFVGETCAEALDRFEDRLAAKGVKLQGLRRQRKRDASARLRVFSRQG